MKNNIDIAKRLDRLALYWKHNANIHQFDGNVSQLQFDPSKPDFSEKLLPFYQHPIWRKASQTIKFKCLSYAWILYNMKTVYIECDIITPVCEDIIKYASNSSNLIKIQQIISEALLDEALHTKMSISACNYIYAKRGLKHLGTHDFYLSQWLRNALSQYKSLKERRWVHFAVACASETLITDYLNHLSNDSNIQRICIEVTQRHISDEYHHSGVFSHVALDRLSDATEIEMSLFKEIILQTLPVFANTEMGEWQKVFEILNFPDYQVIMNETKSLQHIKIYDDSAQKLLFRLGMN